jgi:hypothetical protein
MQKGMPGTTPDIGGKNIGGNVRLHFGADEEHPHPQVQAFFQWDQILELLVRMR